MKRIALIVSGSYALASLVLAGQKATSAEAQALLDKAVKLVQTDGDAKALAAFNNPKGRFVDRELYVFCYGPDGKITAHRDPKMVGTEVAAVKRACGILPPHPADAEIGIKLHQLVRRKQRILHATDFVEDFRVILADVRVAWIDLHRAQIMSFGQSVLELGTGEVAERVFSGGCVGFKRGRAFGRCFLAGEQLALKSRRRVRRVPEAHFIG